MHILLKYIKRTFFVPMNEFYTAPETVGGPRFTRKIDTSGFIPAAQLSATVT